MNSRWCFKNSCWNKILSIIKFMRWGQCFHTYSFNVHCPLPLWGYGQKKQLSSISSLTIWKLTVNQGCEVGQKSGNYCSWDFFPLSLLSVPYNKNTSLKTLRLMRYAFLLISHSTSEELIIHVTRAVPDTHINIFTSSWRQARNKPRLSCVWFLYSRTSLAESWQKPSILHHVGDLGRSPLRLPACVSASWDRSTFPKALLCSLKNTECYKVIPHRELKCSLLSPTSILIPLLWLSRKSMIPLNHHPAFRQWTCAKSGPKPVLSMCLLWHPLGSPLTTWPRLGVLLKSLLWIVCDSVLPSVFCWGRTQDTEYCYCSLVFLHQPSFQSVSGTAAAPFL